MPPFGSPVRASPGFTPHKRMDEKRDGGTDPPAGEVVEWTRSMSDDEQRSRVRAGMRVKVVYEGDIWFSGSISDVINDGQQIIINMDDGTTEVYSVPHPDVVVDWRKYSEKEGSRENSRPPPKNGADTASFAQRRQAMKECRRILALLKAEDMECIFSKPVDPNKGAPGYFDIVSEPMDLGTVQSLLDNNEIDQAGFNRLVTLVFTNAMTYNGTDHAVHQDARRLLKRFEQERQNNTRSPLQDICVSLNNPFYKEVIVDHAKNVHSGRSSLPVERDSAFGRLKSLGTGLVKASREHPTGYTRLSDKEAKKKIYNSLDKTVRRLSGKKGKIDASCLEESHSSTGEVTEAVGGAKRKSAEVAKDLEASRKSRPAASMSPNKGEKGLAKQTKVPVKEEELEAFDLVDLCSPGKEPPSKNPGSEIVASKKSGSGLSLTAKRLPSIKKLPFFKLYEDIKSKLSNAEHDHEANDFFVHLKAYMLQLTRGPGFSVAHFDSTQIQEFVQYFEQAQKQFQNAEIFGDDDSCIYKLQLEAIVKDCKETLVVQTGRPVKCEHEQAIKLED